MLPLWRVRQRRLGWRWKGCRLRRLCTHVGKDALTFALRRGNYFVRLHLCVLQNPGLAFKFSQLGKQSTSVRCEFVFLLLKRCPLTPDICLLCLEIALLLLGLGSLRFDFGEDVLALAQDCSCMFLAVGMELPLSFLDGRLTLS